MFIRTGQVAAAIAILTNLGLAQPVPIQFASAGREISVPIQADNDPDVLGVALRAFGREWSDGLPVEGQTVGVMPPEVRVPVVFQLTQQDKALAELVVYPRWYDLSKQCPLAIYVADDAPAWVAGWTAAVGLSTETWQEVHSADFYRAQTKPVLVVLGRKAAGNSLQDVFDLQARLATNFLIFDADWIAAGEETIQVSPRDCRDELRPFRRQAWHPDLVFHETARPWQAGTINRWAWVESRQLPLVEELRGPVSGSRLVVSYLPWQQQLGRQPVCDELLIAILNAAARPREARFPQPWSVDLVRAESDPVLLDLVSAAQPSEETSESVPNPQKRLWILDLRGPDLTQPEAARVNGWLKQSRTAHLLVLGTDKSVSLEKPRKRKSSDAWRTMPLLRLPDDGLPPTEASQIRLMQTLTRIGIPLNTNFFQQEPDHENSP